jgi:hypothetical protein
MDRLILFEEDGLQSRAQRAKVDLVERTVRKRRGSANFSPFFFNGTFGSFAANEGMKPLPPRRLGGGKRSPSQADADDLVEG